MSEQLFLKITSDKGNIRIISKNRGDISVQTILLKLILGHCWWENLPVVETIFYLIEETIKKTMREVYNYKNLTINYDYRANDLIEDAPKVEMYINSIEVDGIEIEITGRYILLEGDDQRGFWQKRTAFRRKIEENIQKSFN